MAELIPEGSKDNPFKIIWQDISALDKFTKLFLITSLVIAFVVAFATSSFFETRQRAAGISDTKTSFYDLQSYYPNPSLYINYYLSGNNDINPNSQSAVVLWFAPQGQGKFKIYNSSPTSSISTCHWDLLSWGTDNYLRYSQTHDECPGNTPNDIVYSPGIIFLPKFWNSKLPWSLNSQSSASYYQNGALKCTGTISYKAEIVGIEQISPNQPGIHWRTTQTTNWKTGNVPGLCSAGFTTHWQEDYWLTDQLPVQNGNPTKGLKRSKGGNLDITSGNWDVWFDAWNFLPNTNSITPSLTPTPTPVSSKCYYATMCPEIACIQGKPCPTCVPKLVCPTPSPIVTLTPEPSISPTCRPRPLCLDQNPPCQIPVTSDMCPPAQNNRL